MKLNCDVCGNESKSGILKDCIFKCNECFDNDSENDSESDIICKRASDNEFCPTCKKLVRVCREYEYIAQGSYSYYILGINVFKCTPKCGECQSCISTHYQLENGKKLSEIELNEYIAQHKLVRI